MTVVRKRVAQIIEIGFPAILHLRHYDREHVFGYGDITIVITLYMIIIISIIITIKQDSLWALLDL